MRPETYTAWRRATAIPDLGGGGASVAPTLVELASKVAPGKAIVDIGPFLGSTTAYLAMGVIESGADVTIHSYDRWYSDYHLHKRAWKHAKVKLPKDDSFWKLWYANVIDLPVDIVSHKGDIYQAEEPMHPVGLLVDDVTSGEQALDSLFSIFAPDLVEGATVVMMDYFFYKQKTDRRFTETVRWFEDRNKVFEGPDPVTGARNTAATFIYRGGFNG